MSKELRSRFTGQSDEAAILRNAKIIMCDEASMIPGFFLNILDKLLRDLTGINKPFGGKILFLSGDFRQVLPIFKKMGKSQNYCK